MKSGVEQNLRMQVMTKLGSDKEEKKKRKRLANQKIELVALIPNDTNPVNLRGDL